MEMNSGTARQYLTVKMAMLSHDVNVHGPLPHIQGGRSECSIRVGLRDSEENIADFQARGGAWTSCPHRLPFLKEQG
jgi:hypothetical protein